jgi:peptidoglycan hydrolase-like protein with peptidoglycan-binding domain
MARSVKEIQILLQAYGYDIGPDGADGRGGMNTIKAVKKFQLDNRIQVTGQIDQATLRLLFPEDYERKNPMNNILGGVFTGLLGNLFRSQAVLGYIRNILLGLGVYVGAVFSSDQWGLIVGGLMTILAVIFDALSNATKQKAMDVVKAVDASPEVAVVPPSATSDGKPKVVANR